MMIDIRLRDNVGKIIVFGLLIGMALSPYNVLPFLMIQTLISAVTGQALSLFEALTFIVSSLFCPVGFIVGVMRACVWGEYY